MKAVLQNIRDHMDGDRPAAETYLKIPYEELLSDDKAKNLPKESFD